MTIKLSFKITIKGEPDNASGFAKELTEIVDKLAKKWNVAPLKNYSVPLKDPQGKLLPPNEAKGICTLCDTYIRRVKRCRNGKVSPKTVKDGAGMAMVMPDGIDYICQYNNHYDKIREALKQ